MNVFRSSRWRRLGVPLALLVLALIYGWGAVNVTAQFDEGLVGPDFLPLLLTGVVIVGLVLIMRKEWSSSEELADEPGVSSHVRPMGVGVVIMVYIACFKVLGYPLATLILVMVLLSLFGYANGQFMRRILAAAGITVIFYLLFIVCFSVRLPLLPGVSA